MPEVEGLKLLAAGLAAGLGMLGPGIGIGILGAGAMNAIGRKASHLSPSRVHPMARLAAPAVA